ncbi:MAG: presenilin family intramembrane aspartyl protease PSH [Methanomassiliicoccales archaeon]|jgi:presenilin-like A22 family membrane protease
MRVRTPLVAMFLIFISVQLLAILLVPLYPSQYQAFPDVNNPIYPVLYVALLLAMTAVILLLLRAGLGVVIRGFFLFAIGVSTAVVALPLVYLVVPDPNISFLISIALGVLLVVALIFKPEWYVVNTAGFVVGTGAAIILGISFGILPVLILLIILAVYDAISVYKTKHMITLAEGVVPLRLPVMFVVPKAKGFKMADLNDKPLTAEPEEREAMFMGVGDAVIPAILTVSSYVFLPTASGSFQYASLTVALGVVAGSAIGFLVLMRYVLKGNPQAGLPLLNGGAIIGFLITYLLIYQNFSFGLM